MYTSELHFKRFQFPKNNLLIHKNVADQGIILVKILENFQFNNLKVGKNVSTKINP